MFQDIVDKRLDIVPARQATLDEAKNQAIPFDKYYTISPCRTIQKVFRTITLKTNLVYPIYPGQFLFQYNVSVGEPFYIKNAQQQNIRSRYVLTVKFRKGLDVFRYAIAGCQISVNGHINYNSTTFPWYNNELIESNCVFEVWSARPRDILGGNSGLDKDFEVITSILNNPTTPDETKQLIATPDIVDVMGTGAEFPENLPTIQPADIAFLDNP